MDLDDAVARLAALTRLLDDPDSSLLLEDLARSALSLVPSSLAVVIVFDGQADPLATPLATISDRYGQVDAAAGSSLRLEFSSQESDRENRQLYRLIFLAEATDGFSGFRDLQAAAVSTVAAAVTPNGTRHQLTDIVIDQDLDAGGSRRSRNLDRVMQPTGDVDRAIGFLIDRGHEPAEAIRLLENRARAWTLTLDEAADRILSSLD